MVLVFATVAGVFLVSAPAARADHNTIAWSNAIPVAASVGFSYGYSAVVTDGHGYTYVFYTTTAIASSTTNINVTKIAESSGLAGPPQILFDTQVNTVSNVVYAGRISAAVDSQGNLYVAWTRVNVGGYTVYVSKSTDGGASWSSPVLASSPASGGTNLNPALAVAPDGTVYVAWLQIWGGDSATVSKSVDGGQTFGGWTNVSSSVQIREVSLAVDASGRVYVVSDPYQPQLSEYEINVTWSDNGALWSSPVMLSSTSGYSVFPTVFADAGGLVHVAWQHVSVGAVSTEYTQSADRGATWTASLPVTGTYSNSFPDTITGEGDTVMVLVPTSSPTGLSYAISADHGVTWYPYATLATGTWTQSSAAADQNGTFWATSHDATGALDVYAWVGPPSKPVIDGVAASGSDALTVAWTAPPEQNVVDYRIWRSADGTNYQPIALVGAGVTSYTDSGLANGTYYYTVTAINVWGTSSHPSAVAAGTVGVTVAQLESEIAALQGQLSSANANLAALQSQLTALKNQVTALQGTASANNATLAQLQTELNDLQTQLNNLQSQQATQTISYANLAFEVIVVVLLVIVLLNQMRKPKSPRMMMAEPQTAQAPKPPEDDL